MFDLKDDDYVVRLMGTKVAEILGESTGQSMLTIPTGLDAKDRFDWVVENKKPYFNIKPLEGFIRNHISASAVVMPLSSNDNDVDMIILVHHFY